MKAAPWLPLTDECHHYDDLEEVPWDIQKYWHQRYSIFSYYDYDIRLTDDAWFGVTPEPVAIKIAQEMSTSPTFASSSTVVDLFAGAGGNTIALALSGRWARVVGVERDAATLACAQHNAEVYGVPEGCITWVHGDCFEFLAELKEKGVLTLERSEETEQWEDENGDENERSEDIRIEMATTALFASPPWGGVDYRDHEVFDLATMQPYNLAALHEACAPMPHALYLPRTSDLRQVAALAPPGRRVEVVQYCMKGASKAMVAYVPGAEDGGGEGEGEGGDGYAPGI